MVTLGELAQKVAKSPIAQMAQMAQKVSALDYARECIKPGGVMETLHKQQEVVGNLIAPLQSNLWCASGKFTGTPNVKSRATVSQAGGIRPVYPGRCNA